MVNFTVIRSPAVLNFSSSQIIPAKHLDVDKFGTKVQHKFATGTTNWQEIYRVELNCICCILGRLGSLEQKCCVLSCV